MIWLRIFEWWLVINEVALIMFLYAPPVDEDFDA
jgi:hypothetical protein